MTILIRILILVSCFVCFICFIILFMVLKTLKTKLPITPIINPKYPKYVYGKHSDVSPDSIQQETQKYYTVEDDSYDSYQQRLDSPYNYDYFVKWLLNNEKIKIYMTDKEDLSVVLYRTKENALKKLTGVPLLPFPAINKPSLPLSFGFELETTEFAFIPLDSQVLNSIDYSDTKRKSVIDFQLSDTVRVMGGWYQWRNSSHLSLYFRYRDNQDKEIFIKATDVHKCIGDCEFIITYPQPESVVCADVMDTIMKKFCTAISDVSQSVNECFKERPISNTSRLLEINFKSNKILHGICTDNNKEYGLLIHIQSQAETPADIDSVSFVPQVTIGVPFEDVRSLVHLILVQMDITEKGVFSSTFVVDRTIETIVQLLYPYDDDDNDQTEFLRCVLFLALYSFVFNNKKRKQSVFIFRFTFGSNPWLQSYIQQILHNIKNSTVEKRQRIDEYSSVFAWHFFPKEFEWSLQKFQDYLGGLYGHHRHHRQQQQKRQKIQQYQDMTRSNYFPVESKKHRVLVEIRQFQLFVSDDKDSYYHIFYIKDMNDMKDLKSKCSTGNIFSNPHTPA